MGTMIEQMLYDPATLQRRARAREEAIRLQMEAHPVEKNEIPEIPPTDQQRLDLKDRIINGIWSCCEVEVLADGRRQPMQLRSLLCPACGRKRGEDKRQHAALRAALRVSS